jgi:hypothetical protein
MQISATMSLENKVMTHSQCPITSSTLISVTIILENEATTRMCPSTLISVTIILEIEAMMHSPISMTLLILIKKPSLRVPLWVGLTKI